MKTLMQCNFSMQKSKKIVNYPHYHAQYNPKIEVSFIYLFLLKFESMFIRLKKIEV